MQAVVNGLESGLLIAVLALAFSTVYRSSHVFFITLAGVHTVSAYVAWALVSAGWPWISATLLAMGVGTGIAMADGVFNHAPLQRKGASAEVHLVASLGVYLVLVESVAAAWGNQTRTLRARADLPISLGDVFITRTQLVVLAGSAVAITAFFLWFRCSAYGLRIRALAEEPRELALRGHDVSLLRRVSFGMAGLFAAYAALLGAMQTGFGPYSGLNAFLLAVVATVVGGRSLFIGPVAGALLLGFAREGAAWLLAARWQDAATFLLLALVLWVHPQGLSGRTLRVEAQP